MRRISGGIPICGYLWVFVGICGFCGLWISKNRRKSGVSKAGAEGGHGWLMFIDHVDLGETFHPWRIALAGHRPVLLQTAV